MVKERHACGYGDFSFAVKVHFDFDFGFFGFSVNFFCPHFYSP